MKTTSGGFLPIRQVPKRRLRTLNQVRALGLRQSGYRPTTSKSTAVSADRPRASRIVKRSTLLSRAQRTLVSTVQARGSVGEKVGSIGLDNALQQRRARGIGRLLGFHRQLQGALLEVAGARRPRRRP